MLIVKKFGGTSVADKERIYNVARRCIEDYKKGNDIVVVPLYPFRMGKNPYRQRREMTEEEKKVLADRLREARKNIGGSAESEEEE